MFVIFYFSIANLTHCEKAAKNINPPISFSWLLLAYFVKKINLVDFDTHYC